MSKDDFDAIQETLYLYTDKGLALVKSNKSKLLFSKRAQNDVQRLKKSNL